MTDLGTLGGNTSQAGGINDSASGLWEFLLQVHRHPPIAFLWENGVMTDLGGHLAATPAGPMP